MATDHCRACDGKGGAWDQVDIGRRVWVPCWFCLGSGKKEAVIGGKDGSNER